MQHLPQGVADEEGCFVYQICEAIAVRSELNVGDECRTDTVFAEGELVSVDLVRPSRIEGSSNGPFLRLSDCSGWLFEKKYGDVMMKRIPVSKGLWTFVVDNAPAGIALRRHPIDRSDMHVEDVSYKPMQKIYCDRKVQHPSTGINFYRVQGTEGWVFDKRPSSEYEGVYDSMLLEDNMVETGLFVYECIDDNGIAFRQSPNIGDDNRTDFGVEQGQLICADIIRQSPFPHGNGPFLRLSNGSGWLFENKRNNQLMQRVSVKKGEWTFQVINPPGIALRSQPIDSQSLCEPTVYAQGEIIRCTHMVQASSGVNFFRVEGTDGWVFDERDGRSLLTLISEQGTLEDEPVFSTREGGTSWSPDFVREIAAAVEGVSEVSFNKRSRVISFVATESDNVRINVYYTTRTIGTALVHPHQGTTQLFRRNCTAEELLKIFENPRAHTGKGYKRRVNDPSSFSSEIVYTPYGSGLLVDQESELRNELLELDEDIGSMILRKKQILKVLRDADLKLAQESTAFERKVIKKNIERKERERAAEAEREAEQLRIEELQSRTCPVCSSVFQSTHAKNQHYNAVHVYVYRCDYCHKEFNNAHSLRQHEDALGHW